MGVYCSPKNGVLFPSTMINGMGETLCNVQNPKLEATHEILEAQLERYSDTLKADIDFLEEFSQYNKTADIMGRIVFDDQNRECINFGKFKGTPVEDVFRKEPGYYGWLMNGDFPLSTKKVFKDIMDKLKAKNQAARS